MNDIDFRYLTKVGAFTLAYSVLGATLVYLAFDAAIALHLMRAHLI